MQDDKMKITVSAVILIVGLVATVLALPATSDTVEQSGILVDFGDYDVTYTGVDTGAYGDPVSALEFACMANDFDLVMDDGTVVSISGKQSDGTSSWKLYVVDHDGREWEIADSEPSSLSMDDYKAVCWAYCAPGSLPAPAVDSTGVCFYGYDEPRRIVTLAPACTEYVCSVGAVDSIVATDYYSNYPSEVVDGQEDGSISFIGGFTNPSYESILKQDPDLVVCVDSVSAHLSMAEKLRKAGVDVIVASGGESVDSVMENIFMVGAALNGSDEAGKVMETSMGQIDSIGYLLDSDASVWDKRVMVSLSAVKSPFVAGSGTFIGDILSIVSAENIYADEGGYPQINVESVVKKDPEVIIIVTSGYPATQDGYDDMLDALSSEWRSTTAYRNGDIYMLVDGANDLASRPGPRVAQLTELVARIIHPAAFDDDVQVPRYIGSDYADYLPITVGGETVVAGDAGILIDRGGYDVTYAEVDPLAYGDPVSALTHACSDMGVPLDMTGGNVVAIDGLYPYDGRSWNLYVVEKGCNTWTRTTSDPSSLEISDYTAVCWGYCTPDDLPAPAVDLTGEPIYGHGDVERIVTLAPAITEYVCAIGATDRIVATDEYSNHPSVIVERQKAGTVALVGGYTNPSYDAIIAQDPDLVICLDSPSSHRSMAERLREAGITVVMVSAGETPAAVPENTFVIGTMLNMADEAADLIGSSAEQMAEIAAILDSPSVTDKRVMVPVTAVPSPFVVGADTFIDDILTMSRADNVFAYESGWPQVDGDTIARLDPEVMIIIDSGYSATAEDYQALLDSLSDEWKSTTAYRNGEVYILVGEANDLASRVGPRLPQSAELFARILHPEAFDDGVVIPKYIGDDYVDHLTITNEDVIE